MNMSDDYKPTDTCRDVYEDPDYFKCSKCGATYVSTDYAYYCPSCGRKVIDE